MHLHGLPVRTPSAPPPTKKPKKVTAPKKGPDLRRESEPLAAPSHQRIPKSTPRTFQPGEIYGSVIFSIICCIAAIFYVTGLYVVPVVTRWYIVLKTAYNINRRLEDRLRRKEKEKKVKKILKRYTNGHST